jgi:YfiH family protein
VSDPMASGQPFTANLGGGFVFLRRADGVAAIIASGMADTGAIGIMSNSDINARDDGELRGWLTAWAFPDQARLRRVNQVHGGAVVDAASYNGGAPDADGMWTRSPADLLVVRVADCAPVWLVDPATKTIALAHAGWRGVAAGIIENAIGALVRAGGSASGFFASVGPHLGPCCFEVGPEVARAFARDPGAVRPPGELKVERHRSDGVALDLSAAIAHRLAVEGVDPGRIVISNACTRCRHDILHSYRRNGSGGPLMAAVGAVLA